MARVTLVALQCGKEVILAASVALGEPEIVGSLAVVANEALNALIAGRASGTGQTGVTLDTLVALSAVGCRGAVVTIEAVSSGSSVDTREALRTGGAGEPTLSAQLERPLNLVVERSPVQ